MVDITSKPDLARQSLTFKTNVFALGCILVTVQW